MIFQTYYLQLLFLIGTVGLVVVAALETAGFAEADLLGVTLTPGLDAAVLAPVAGVFLGVAVLVSFPLMLSLMRIIYY